MDGVVPLQERRKRNDMLSILCEKKRRYFYNQHLGQTRPVLLEKGKKPGFLTGFTDNYVKVEVELEETWINHVVDMDLTEITSEGAVKAKLPFGAFVE